MPGTSSSQGERSVQEDEKVSSVLSRDDLMAQVYSAGVRNPREVSRIMRLIDIYAFQMARKPADDEDGIPAVTAPAFTPLAPGEWSPALQVTCCVGCTRVRRWDDYHIDKHHPTGHKIMCKDCRKLSEDKTLPEKARDVRRGGWVCPQCLRRKIPVEFPLEKRENPRKSLKCLSCMT